MAGYKHASEEELDDILASKCHGYLWFGLVAASTTMGTVAKRKSFNLSLSLSSVSFPLIHANICNMRYCMRCTEYMWTDMTGFML